MLSDISVFAKHDCTGWWIQVNAMYTIIGQMTEVCLKIGCFGLELAKEAKSDHIILVTYVSNL